MLIDVRTKEEYEENHHEGAVNIPIDEIETYTFYVPNERLVLCSGGGSRARLAQTILTRQGLRKVTLLNGTGACG